MARFPRNHRKWVAQEDISNSFLHSLAGDNSEEATPDPIPNSEVKLFCVDGTAWVTMWESRSSPAFFCFCAASAASLRRSRTNLGTVGYATLAHGYIVSPLRGSGSASVFSPPSPSLMEREGEVSRRQP